MSVRKWAYCGPNTSCGKRVLFEWVINPCFSPFRLFFCFISECTILNKVNILAYLCVTHG